MKEQIKKIDAVIKELSRRAGNDLYIWEQIHELQVINTALRDIAEGNN